MSCARWSAPALADNVPHLRQAVVDFACVNGVSESVVVDVRLAISEALTNAILHAYHRYAQPGSVRVSASIEREWIELRVADDGSGFAPRDDSPGLGLGIPLINRLADQVELRRRPDVGGTEVRMRFRL